MRKLQLNYKGIGIYPFLGKAQTIVDSVARNAAVYPDPFPSLNEVQNLINITKAAAIDAESGDHQKIAAKNSLRALLAASIKTLGSYCENRAQGDTEKLIASGFDLQKSRTAIGQLQPVDGVAGTFTGISGRVALKWSRLYGAKTYVIEGRHSGEQQFTQLGLSTKAGFTTQGLSAGVWEFRIVALSTAGRNAPSNVVKVSVA